MTREEIIEYNKLRSEILKKATIKSCFINNDECEGHIISAHSLQKMGSLRLLESDLNNNKGIYALTKKELVPNSNNFKLIPIGKKKASTFHGFCKHHDTLIFNSIENEHNQIDIDSDKDCFLISYRAFAISYHRKIEELNLLKTNDVKFKKKLLKYYNVSSLDEVIKGVELAVNENEKLRKKLNTLLLNKAYSSLEYFAYQINYAVPFALTMYITPFFFNSGKEINRKIDGDFVDFCFSVIPTKDKTFVLVSAINNLDQSRLFLDELESLPEQKLQKWLSWLVLTTCENVFFNPIFFDSLPFDTQQEIIKTHVFAGSLNTGFISYDSNRFKLNFFKYKL